MKRDILGWLGAAMILTACASSPNESDVKSASQNSLSARELDPGECGLFVWAGEARRFILFSQAGQGAILASGGNDVTLTAKTSQTNGDLYGQVPVQSFLGSDGIAYDLNLSGESELDGGTRYAHGTWRYKDEQGWDVLTPVYGLSTCRPIG